MNIWSCRISFNASTTRNRLSERWVAFCFCSKLISVSGWLNRLRECFAGDRVVGAPRRPPAENAAQDALPCTIAEFYCLISPWSLSPFQLLTFHVFTNFSFFFDNAFLYSAPVAVYSHNSCFMLYFSFPTVQIHFTIRVENDCPTDPHNLPVFSVSICSYADKWVCANEFYVTMWLCFAGGMPYFEHFEEVGDFI